MKCRTERQEVTEVSRSPVRMSINTILKVIFDSDMPVQWSTLSYLLDTIWNSSVVHNKTSMKLLNVGNVTNSTIAHTTIDSGWGDM